VPAGHVNGARIVSAPEFTSRVGNPAFDFLAGPLAPAAHRGLDDRAGDRRRAAGGDSLRRHRCSSPLFRAAVHDPLLHPDADRILERLAVGLVLVR
jgi:hypothetical protein